MEAIRDRQRPRAKGKPSGHESGHDRRGSDDVYHQHHRTAPTVEQPPTSLEPETRDHSAAGCERLTLADLSAAQLCISHSPEIVTRDLIPEIGLVAILERCVECHQLLSVGETTFACGVTPA